MSRRMQKCLYLFILCSFLPKHVYATDCGKLSPLVCLISVRCTLDYTKVLGVDDKVVDGRRLICRREEGECEMAKSQATLTKEDCEANEKCKFVPPGPCFVPCYYDDSCGDTLYECSGGRPPNCVVKEIIRK